MRILEPHQGVPLRQQLSVAHVSRQVLQRLEESADPPPLLGCASQSAVEQRPSLPAVTQSGAEPLSEVACSRLHSLDAVRWSLRCMLKSTARAKQPRERGRGGRDRTTDG